MAFFLKHVPSVNWTVYLVKTEAGEDPENSEKEEYLGVFDDWSDQDCRFFGPFKTKDAALADEKAWIAWR